MSSFTIVRRGPAATLKIPLSMMARKVTKPSVATSNKYEALKSTVDMEDKLPTTPSVFDKIVWKSPTSGRPDARPSKAKASKAGASKDKAHDYLHNGKTFSLDNYLHMVQSSHKSGLGRLPASLLMSRTKITLRKSLFS